MRQPKQRIPAQGLDLKDQVISINRVTKVVKGGKNLSFAALVVVGDEGGHVGFGTGKAREVPLAIKKGIESAKKNLIRVPLINNTLPHQLIGEYGAGRVLVKPASEGTGVIAGGAVRAVMQAVGVRDVRTKVLGSTNPHNVVRATFDALLRMKDPMELARGKAGRLVGNLTGLLTTLKGLPSSYDKDLQEDKEPFFDALKTAHDCLAILGDMVPRVEFDGVNMKRALAAGYVLATDVADYLASKGMPFRDAHRVVGEIVAYCQSAGKELKDLSLAQWKKFDRHFDKDLFDWLDEEHAVDRRASPGGTSRRGVRKAIAEAKVYLKKSTRLVAQIPQIKK